MKESLRSFLERKANNVTPQMERIINLPDGLAEKVTTNIPLGGLIYEKRIKEAKRTSIK